VNDYATGGKPAVDAAFLATFGIAQSDPAVVDITSAQMSDFLDNQFAALFANPAWGADWSTASNQNRTQRISPSEKVDTSVNANDTAMRKLAMAYTMVADLGTTGLNADARNVLLSKATTIIGGAVSDVTSLQGQLGDVKKRVGEASDRMKQNRDLLASQLNALEGVDPAEAKVRSDSFSAELEMSYSLTNKLLHLSILNYA
jgi:flagellar hook-associated protein 3 FlgL